MISPFKGQLATLVITMIQLTVKTKFSCLNVQVSPSHLKKNRIHKTKKKTLSVKSPHDLCHPHTLTLNAGQIYSKITNEGVRVQQLAKYAIFCEDALFRKILVSGSLLFILSKINQWASTWGVAHILSTRGDFTDKVGSWHVEAIFYNASAIFVSELISFLQWYGCPQLCQLTLCPESNINHP